MWQSHYGYQWSLDRDRLLVVSAVAGGEAWALPPVGPPPRADLCRRVLGWLQERVGVADPAIERADPRLAAELAGHPEFVVEPMRDHFDYVYRTEDLIRAGRRALPRQAQPHQQPGPVRPLPLRTSRGRTPGRLSGPERQMV